MYIFCCSNVNIICNCSVHYFEKRNTVFIIYKYLSKEKSLKSDALQHCFNCQYLLIFILAFKDCLYSVV